MCGMVGATDNLRLPLVGLVLFTLPMYGEEKNQLSSFASSSFERDEQMGQIKILGFSKRQII